MPKACQANVFRAPCWPGGTTPWNPPIAYGPVPPSPGRGRPGPGDDPLEPPIACGPVPPSPGRGRPGPGGTNPASVRAALRGHAVLVCDVTQIAPTLGGAGDAVNARERQQFEEFMTSRWPGLVRLAFGLTGDRWLAEDLAQTALVNAYASWWRVHRADDPDAYVRRILINASRNRWRRSRVAELHVEPPAEVPDPAPDPATAIGERSALLKALGELPPRQRAVVVLRYWEDLSDAQAASLLGCSASTVRSQAARALAKLRASGALAQPSAGDGTPRRQAGGPR